MGHTTWTTRLPGSVWPDCGSRQPGKGSRGRKGDVRTVKVPHGTRYLLITCADANDGQFRGVAQAYRLLAKADGVHHLAWDGGRPLQLAGRRTLRWVVVSGHGTEGDARVSDGRGRSLCPRDLQLAPGVDLYLLACYQG